MYKAYLVIGGESTGTRLMARILIDAGCFGDYLHKQRLDVDLTKYVPSKAPIVWRRSMPHGKCMIDIEEEFILPIIHSDIEEDEIFMVVTTRNWMCAAMSSYRAGHAHSIGQAMAEMEQAYINIFTVLGKYSNMPYHLVSYEFLVRAEDTYIKYLLAQTHLEPKGRLLLIKDENSKYIAEARNAEGKITE